MSLIVGASTTTERKAGTGSAVNDATREFGGTLGVAVIGSVFTSLYIHGLESSRVAAVVPAALFARSKESVGAALLGARQLANSHPHPASLLTRAAHHAFFDGFKVGCLVAAGVAQEDLAEQLDIHRTYMGGIERGERNLTLRSIERIAQHLGVDPLVVLTPLD